MPALPPSLISSLSAATAAAVTESATGLPAALPNPRARRGIRHRLTVVVTAAVCAVVAGCRSYIAIAEWVADLPDHTAGRRGMAASRPSSGGSLDCRDDLREDLLLPLLHTPPARSRPTSASRDRRAVLGDLPPHHPRAGSFAASWVQAVGKSKGTGTSGYPAEWTVAVG
jgi:hypothetical protein